MWKFSPGLIQLLKTLNNINHNLRELPFTRLWLSCLECHVFAYSPHVLIGGDVTLWKHANSLITVVSELNADAAVLRWCVCAALLMIDCCRLLTWGRCPLVKNGSVVFFCLPSVTCLRYSTYIFFCCLSKWAFLGWKTPPGRGSKQETVEKLRLKWKKLLINVFSSLARVRLSVIPVEIEESGEASRLTGLSLVAIYTAFSHFFLRLRWVSFELKFQDNGNNKFKKIYIQMETEEDKVHLQNGASGRKDLQKRSLLQYVV